MHPAPATLAAPGCLNDAHDRGAYAVGRVLGIGLAGIKLGQDRSIATVGASSDAQRDQARSRMARRLSGAETNGSDLRPDES